MSGVSARLAQVVVAKPWAPLALGVALLALVAVGALGAPRSLGVGSLALDDAAQPPAITVQARGDRSVRPAVFRVALDVITSQVEADRAVSRVRRGRGGGDRSGALLVSLDSDAPGDRLAAIERLESAIDPGPLRVTVAGEEAALGDARRELGGDLWRVELLVLPLALLVLVVALGLRLAAAAAGAVALAVLAAPALLRLAGELVDVSLLGAVPAAPLGAALAIELTALLGAAGGAASGAPSAGARRADSIGDALERLARPVALALALTLVPGLALLATPLDQAASLALGCAFAALGALAGALTFGLAALATGAKVTPRETGRLAGACGRIAGAGRRGLALVGGLTLGLLALGVLARDGRSEGLAAPPQSGSLFPELALALGIAFVLCAAGLALAARRVRAAPLALLVVAPAIAAVGLAVLVFQEGALDFVARLEQQPALETAALAAAAVAAIAILAARAALLFTPRVPAAAAAGASTQARQLAGRRLAGAAAASLVVGLAAGALVAVDLPAARQFGAIVAVALALDLLLLRLPAIAVAGRLSNDGVRRADAD